MAWHDVLGHDDVVEHFRRCLARARLASSFLFVGPPGIGKRAFAQRLTQTLLCQNRPVELMDPCGQCPSCTQVLAGTHPDLDVVEKPPEKSFIPLSLFIGEPAQRMREGLCHRIQLKPYSGGRKIAIVDDADALNEESANCLLKTLEEPPPQSVLILIGTSPDKQLPTIRSRCQIIRFRPLSEQSVAELLLARGVVDSPAEAHRLAEHSDGSLQHALELADTQLWEFRRQFILRLVQPQFDSVALARAMNAFVETAGKEAVARRGRIRQVIGFAIELYRLLLRVVLDLPITGDADVQQAATQLAARWTLGPEAITACLDRCLEALGQLERNANQSTLIDCWLDDLAHTVRRTPAMSEVI